MKVDMEIDLKGSGMSGFQEDAFDRTTIFRRSTSMKNEGNAVAILPASRARGERGTGSTITIDLTEYPDLLQQIRDAAKKDDREPSKWVRRQIVLLGDGFFLGKSEVTK